MTAHTAKKNSQKIPVWIVDDNELFQQNLSDLINTQRDMACTASFSSCEEFIDNIGIGLQPQVILHDIGFPGGMSGIESVRAARELLPSAHVVMITVFDDSDHLFEALQAGAIGYVLKSSTEEMILSSVHDAVAGGSPMNASIARKMVDVFAKLNHHPKEYTLTEQELVVLDHISHGLSNTDIGKKMNLSVHTIDSHLRKIYQKLHVHSRTEAAAKAAREKLL